MLMNIYTNSYTYIRTRIAVIGDHFEMFLTCAGMSKYDVKKMLLAVDNKELDAVGIYIEDEGFRIAEVEFEIDWDEHQRMVGVYGTRFNTDLAGWANGVAPEAYVTAQRLVKVAKDLKKPVRSWIRVSESVRENPEKHKRVCDKLGYTYGGKVSPWKNTPVEQKRNVNYLPEAKVIRRVSE